MPFDSIPNGRLTLADLAWRLRHPETWPPGFEWDYGSCSSCAQGLAWELAHPGRQAEPLGYLTGTNLRDSLSDIGDIKDARWRIFWGLGAGGVGNANVRPEDVADAIDAVLARETVHAV